jgi:hypothetical protein
MIKNYYASSSEQMENLRQTLRSQKLFDKLANDVKANPVSKDAFQQKHN